jgi:hypothetical protein
MIIKGYKWKTVEEADLVMAQLNEFYGLPVPNGITIFDNRAYRQIDDFYFLDEDEMSLRVLGEPIAITIDVNM